MLLLRYLVSVGGVLLGLLLWVNWYFPPSASEASTSGVDRTIIRIHSARQWPTAVPIDTSMQMPKIAPLTVSADNEPAIRPDAPPREALALAATAEPKASGKIRRRTRSASRFTARETHRRLASSQDNWFGATW
jgi:hypothetical protein